MKREATSPSIIIHDSKNIGVYGMGRLNWPSNPSHGGFNQVLGKSDNILFATIVLDNKKSSTVTPILEENIDGLPYTKIDYPNCISVYKRGELTDLDSLQITGYKESLIEKNVTLSCYPNPVENELNILVHAPAGSKFNITIFNIMSEVVYIHSADHHSGSSYELKWKRDTSLPSGLYCVKVEGEDFNRVSRILL
jgi:hypothetical protein